MKDPLGVSPSKGNQGTTRGKERSNPEVVGSIPIEVKRVTQGSPDLPIGS